MQYNIVSSHNETDLVEEVQKMLDAGWQLQGNVSATYTVGLGYLFVQAMIKESE